MFACESIPQPRQRYRHRTKKGEGVRTKRVGVVGVEEMGKMNQHVQQLGPVHDKQYLITARTYSTRNSPSLDGPRVATDGEELFFRWE